MCVWQVEGECVLESPQFHTCLILSEFGVKDLWRSECVGESEVGNAGGGGGNWGLLDAGRSCLME